MFSRGGRLALCLIWRRLVFSLAELVEGFPEEGWQDDAFLLHGSIEADGELAQGLHALRWLALEVAQHVLHP
eukprot:5889081-Lingulodinium_polyedra.AAC.1